MSGEKKCNRIKKQVQPSLSKTTVCLICVALKKAFAEDKEIQKLVDDEFIILNLMVSEQ